MSSTEIQVHGMTSVEASVMSRLKRGFSYSMLGQFSGYAIALFLAPVYTRAMSPSEFGVVALTNSIRSMLLMLMPMSTAGAVTYWFNLNRSNRCAQRASVGGISGLCLLFSLLWLIVGLAAGPFVQKAFFSTLPLSFWPYIVMVECSAWLLSLQSIPMGVLAARERQDWYAVITTAVGLLQSGAIVVMVAFMHRGAAGQVEAMFLACVATAPMFIWLLWREAPPKINLSLWKDVSRYSIPLVPHQLSVWALNLSDRLIIAHYGRPFAHDLGLYSLGYAVAMIMLAFVSALNAIWAPVYMEQARSNEDAPVVLGRLSAWCCLGLAVVASWLIVFSPGIVALVGGTKYLGSERFVAPVVLGYFMQGVYQFPAMGLFHMNKTKLLPAITVASVILNISLNFAFIPRFGVIVAAWSTFAGFSVMAILGFAICHPIYSLVYPRRPLFAAAAILIGSFSLNQVHGFAFVTLGFKATVWCAALGLLWKLFGQDFLQLTRS